jgi:glycosyltransferase involved in cell wall biosynthesis
MIESRQSCRRMPQASLSAPGPLRVFVFLAHGFGAASWTKRWSSGNIPGFNEKLPYGYYHAANDFCVVQYSEDAAEHGLTPLVRKAMRRLLGFDLMHAWRNRKDLFSADVVWTHTELEYLAALLLWRYQRRETRPTLIAGTVWLFDQWEHLSRPKRWFYRRLIDQADIVTVMSPDNLKLARELFPKVRTEIVLFGSNIDSLTPPERRAIHRPLRIASLGNDTHRDWETLGAVAKHWDECEIRIASKRVGSRLARRVKNVSIVPASSQREITGLYSWADFVVVPLKTNLHASGITVVCEAVLLGKPVVCTDVGGLRIYFSGEEVCYVPPYDAQAIRCALEKLAADEERCLAMTRRAQTRILSANLTSRAFANRHYEISREILGLRVCQPDGRSGAIG